MTDVAELAASIEVQGAATATAQLAGFGKQIDATAAQAESAAKRSMSHDDALRKVGTTSLIAGGLVVTGMGLAIGATMRFDSAISEVNAVADVNARQLGRLKDAAIEAGQATVFSASESAQAEAELAKAGLSTADILKGGLRGALDLASAGQLELGDAAIITAEALNIFQLDGTKASHVADVLAAGANKSAADVGQLGDALRQGGLLAKQTGLSLEDTVGTLALFADNALIGSDAGTSLKTMLQRLTPQSAEAKAEMQRLGISAYDSAGQFIGLEKFSGNLRSSLEKLTPEQRNAALATIFGSDAVRAANLIYEAGPDKIRNYVRAVNDQGAASDMAGKKLDNLGGDIEQLSGSIETQLIKSGSGATTVLRFLAQGATESVNAFTDLPGPVQTGVTALVALAGIGLTAAGALAIGVTKVHQMRDALESAFGAQRAGQIGAVTGGLAKMAAGAAIAGVSFSAMDDSVAGTSAGILGLTVAGGMMGSTFGPVGTVIGGTTGAIVGLSKAMFGGGESAKEYSGRIGELTKQITDLGAGASAKKFLDETKVSFSGLEKESYRASEQFKATKRALAEMAGDAPAQAERVARGLHQMGDESGLTKAQLEVLDGVVARGADRFKAHADNAAGAAKKNKEFADSTGDAAEETSAFADSLADADTHAKNFQTTIDVLLGIGLDVESANLRWRDSIDAITKSYLENGATLDINTEAGRNNREALAGSTQQALALAEAQFRASGSIDQANGTISTQISQLNDSAHAMGLTDEQALTYIEDLFNIPADVRTTIFNTADLAAYVTKLLQDKYNEIDGRHVNTTVTADTSQAEEALKRLNQGFGSLRDQVLAAGGNPAAAYQAASGMVVDPRPGGTLVNVGEAGAREVILPTNDDARAMDLIRQAGLSHLLGGGGSSAAMPAASPGPHGDAPTQVFQFYGQMDPGDAAEEFRWAIMRPGI